MRLSQLRESVDCPSTRTQPGISPSAPATVSLVAAYSMPSPVTSEHELRRGPMPPAHCPQLKHTMLHAASRGQADDTWEELRSDLATARAHQLVGA